MAGIALPSSLSRLLRRAVDVRPPETAALLLAFAYFFCLMCGYYLLRPLRDAMGIAGGTAQLPWLFSATFAAMLALVPAFGALSARMPPRRFVPWVYRFFALNILGFAALFAWNVREVAVARVFFVWLSVFNLFVVSIFWSVLADRFSSAQGKRLFGFIAAGGTAGALAGPALAAILSVPFGTASLALLAALLLELAVQCFRALDRRTGGNAPEQGHEGSLRAAPDGAGHAGNAGTGGLGGGMFAGVGLILRDRYLAGIALYMLLHTLASTFLYLEQGRIVAAALADTAARARLFALVDLGVSVATLALQAAVTGRFLRRFGVTAALALLPAAGMLAFAGITLWPALGMVAAMQGLRRAVDFAIARPGREILFTVMSREAKYKAKSVIETVVYRGGDAASGWIFAALAAAGIGFSGVTLLFLPLTAGWIWLSCRLGRRQEERARRIAVEQPPPDASAASPSGGTDRRFT